jgi:hypothetical protein
MTDWNERARWASEMGTSLRTSPETGALIAALVEAQKAFTAVGRDKTADIETRSGGTYTYRYADLASVVEVVRKPMLDNGLVLIQMPSSQLDAEGVARQMLVTRLAHTSGEWIEGSLTLPVRDPSPQGLGSAITYARRYMLSAVLGVVTEDDDDAQAAERDEARGHRPAPSGVQRGTDGMSGAISDRQKAFIHVLLGEMGVPNDNDVRRAIVLAQAKAEGATRVSDLTKAQGKRAIDQIKAWHDEGSVWEPEPGALVLVASGDVVYPVEPEPEREEDDPPF